MGLWRQWADELKGTFDTRWLIVAAVATLGVLGATHIPQEAMPMVLQRDGLDKFEHIGAYGMMAALFLLSLKKSLYNATDADNDGRRRRWEVRGGLGLAVLIAIGLAALGSVDEWTQPFVKRTCSVWDWTADVVGITVVCAIFAARGIVYKREVGRQDR
jgi:hypothetical protein